jgi:hypothetical protein
MHRNMELLPHSIAQNIQHFTGRNWILTPLTDWLTSEQRILIIKGCTWDRQEYAPRVAGGLQPTSRGCGGLANAQPTIYWSVTVAIA